MHVIKNIFKNWEDIVLTEFEVLLKVKIANGTPVLISLVYKETFVAVKSEGGPDDGLSQPSAQDNVRELFII